MTGAPDEGPDVFARAGLPIDAAAIERLAAYEAALKDWSTRLNLVSPSTLDRIWTRHFLDSAQLLPLLPRTSSTLADLGAGAGFPGLVLAACLADRPGFKVTLIESIAKKCAFLEAAIEAMGLQGRARVLNARAEAVTGRSFDVLTARAVAPLDMLLSYAQRLKRSGTVCLFLKGKTALDELTEARKAWRIAAKVAPSRTDPDAKIIAVLAFERLPRRTTRRAP